MEKKKSEMIFLGYASPWKRDNSRTAKLERSNNFRPEWNLYAPSFEPGKVYRRDDHRYYGGRYDYVLVVGDDHPEGYGVEIYSYMALREEVMQLLEEGHIKNWRNMEKPLEVRLVHTPPILMG